jgi:hypothetical protein
MIVTQVHLVLGATHNRMQQTSHVLKECEIGMLTAGMSTRAIVRELNMNFSTISRLQRHFREFAVRPTSLTTADHVDGVVWMNGLLMSMME